MLLLRYLGMMPDFKKLSTRVCPNCNRIHPPTSYQIAYCKNCGTVLNTQICSGCGRELPTEELVQRNTQQITRLCKICYKDRKEKGQRRMNSKAYLNKVNKLRTLEEVYQESVDKYKISKFNGLKISAVKVRKAVDRKYRCCALCLEGPIEGYHMLIPMSKGGTYEPTNVIPICEDCLKLLQYDINPLVSLSKGTNKSADRKLYARMLKLLDNIGIKDKYDIWYEGE